jgi:hypothetical protein
MLHVKSAGIHWCNGGGVMEPGIAFISHFRRGVTGDSSVLTQRDQDLEVKKWLEESGGVESENLQWISFVDTTWIALTGTTPTPSNVDWSGLEHPISNEEFKAKLEAYYRDHPLKPLQKKNMNAGSQPLE